MTSTTLRPRKWDLQYTTRGGHSQCALRNILPFGELFMMHVSSKYEEITDGQSVGELTPMNPRYESMLPTRYAQQMGGAMDFLATVHDEPFQFENTRQRRSS